MNLLSGISPKLGLFILGGMAIFSLAKAADFNPPGSLNRDLLNREGGIRGLYGTLIVSEASAQRFLDARQLAALKDLQARFRFDSKITGIGPNVYFLRREDDRQNLGEVEPTPLKKNSSEQRPVILPKFDAERF